MSERGYRVHCGNRDCEAVLYALDVGGRPFSEWHGQGCDSREHNELDRRVRWAVRCGESFEGAGVEVLP